MTTSARERLAQLQDESDAIEAALSAAGAIADVERVRRLRARRNELPDEILAAEIAVLDEERDDLDAEDEAQSGKVAAAREAVDAAIARENDLTEQLRAASEARALRQLTLEVVTNDWRRSEGRKREAKAARAELVRRLVAGDSEPAPAATEPRSQSGFGWTPATSEVPAFTRAGVSAETDVEEVERIERPN